MATDLRHLPLFVVFAGVNSVEAQDGKGREKLADCVNSLTDAEYSCFDWCLMLAGPRDCNHRWICVRWCACDGPLSLLWHDICDDVGFEHLHLRASQKDVCGELVVEVGSVHHGGGVVAGVRRSVPPCVAGPGLLAFSRFERVQTDLPR